MEGDCRLQPGHFRRVVLHADDFGMNAAVTQGIVRGFTHGLLTSTAVLANAPDCHAALSAWRTLLERDRCGGLPSTALRRRLGDSRLPFDLGVHLNLTQGKPLTGGQYPAELLDRDGRFPGIFKFFRKLAGAELRYRAQIAAELQAQIEVVRDSGFAPTHLNGHQYIEILPGVAAIIPALLAKYGIPVVRVGRERQLLRTTLMRRFQVANWFLAQVKRSFATAFLREMDRCGVTHPDSFFGTSHAGRIDLALMRRFLADDLRPGVTEIGMHPGLMPDAAAVSPLKNGWHDPLVPVARASSPCVRKPLPDDGWHDPLARLRSDELALVTSPELAELLDSSRIRLGRLGELSQPLECRLQAMRAG